MQFSVFSEIKGQRLHQFLYGVSFLSSESGVNTCKSCKLEERVDLHCTFDVSMHFRQDKLYGKLWQAKHVKSRLSLKSPIEFQ